MLLLPSTTLAAVIGELTLTKPGFAHSPDGQVLQRLWSRRLRRVGDVLSAAIPEVVTTSQTLSALPKPGGRGQILMRPAGYDEVARAYLGMLVDGSAVACRLAEPERIGWDRLFYRAWQNGTVNRPETSWIQYAVRSPKATTSGPLLLLHPERWLDAPWQAYGWPVRPGPVEKAEDLQRGATFLSEIVAWQKIPRETWTTFGSRDGFLRTLNLLTGGRTKPIGSEERLWALWQRRAEVLDLLRVLTAPRDAKARQSLPLLPAGRLVRNAREAELYAAEVLRAVGFVDADVTPVGPDGGVDVLGSRVVAQVKMEAVPARALVLQALAGIAAVDGKLGAFFSSAGYTSDALAGGERAQMALFGFHLNGELQPLSAQALRWTMEGALTDP